MVSDDAVTAALEAQKKAIKDSFNGQTVDYRQAMRSAIEAALAYDNIPDEPTPKKLIKFRSREDVH